MGPRSGFDVAIVGGRCSGAALAALLARDGASVVLLDKDRWHTDHVLSTHTIHPPALDVLDDLGVGDAVRAGCRPSRTLRLAKNDAFVEFSYAEGRAEYCPRRHRLDGLLQDAARAAGAEMIESTRLTALVWDGDRVVGVRTTDASGVEREIRAGLVVGADGRHSTVAKLVDAEEYLGYDGPRAVYWGYWHTPAAWRAYPFDFYLGNKRGGIRVVFQTDNDQLLIGSAPPRSDLAAWRQDAGRALLEDLRQDPIIAPLVDGNPRDGDVRGTVKERYFFRESAGPGWVLVGDAGHHKDFVVGDGITEALIQVQSLAAAIGDHTDTALVRWWRARDIEALPHYFFAQDEGALGEPLKIQEVVFQHVNKSPQLRARMAQVPEHQLSPYDALPVGQVLRWTLGAALTGSPGVLRDFLKMGKRGAMVAHEMKARRALLARATTQIAYPSS